MNEILVLLLMFVALINLSLGIIVLTGAKRTARSKLFFLFTLAITAWCFGIAMFYTSQNAEEALFYAKFYYIAAAVIGFSIITFALSYIKNFNSRPWLIAAAIPTAIICAVTVHPDGLISGIDIVGKHEVVLNKDLYNFYVIYFLTYLYAALTLIAYHYIKRTQVYSRDVTAMRYVFLAFILAGTVGVYFNLILPLFEDYSLIWVGPLASIVMVWFIFAAIIRFGLFDVRLAIARTAGYILSFTFLALVYSLTVILIQSIFSGLQTSSSQIFFANIGLLLLLATTFQPLKKFFDTATDKIFLKKRYDTKETLDAVGEIVTRSVDRDELVKSTLRSLDKALRVTFIEVVLFEGESLMYRSSVKKSMKHPEALVAGANSFGEKITMTGEIIDLHTKNMFQRSDIVICARLETATGRLGYLFFGNKESGERYNLQDIELLNVITYELAIAIENSSRFKEIQDFSETLQQKIATATSELKQTNKKLQELDESKDEFISMASHQLRTPLTTVKGYISMLLDGDLGEITPSQRKVLEEAFSSSQRMVYLIGDFLNVSRLQTGKFELESHEFDLSEVVGQEVRQMEDGARSRKMKLDYQRPHGAMPVSLDENKIRQVIMNFIDNAIYYSNPGDTIQIVLARQAGNISLKVVDHGIGVPASERHRLFSKFYRATNAKKQRPDGTGIGLFMARKVVVAHGGTIIFETSEGKGSTFGFRLPLSK